MVASTLVHASLSTLPYYPAAPSAALKCGHGARAPIHSVGIFVRKWRLTARWKIGQTFSPMIRRTLRGTVGCGDAPRSNKLRGVCVSRPRRETELRGVAKLACSHLEKYISVVSFTDGGQAFSIFTCEKCNRQIPLSKISRVSLEPRKGKARGTVATSSRKQTVSRVFIRGNRRKNDSGKQSKSETSLST